MKNLAGVYEILNTVNGKRYIGSAVKFQRRWVLHRWELRRGTHGNTKLQCAWNKYGEGAFVFGIVLVCAREDTILYEQLVMDALIPEYNICKCARSALGVKRSPETRAKISAAKTGVRLPPKSAEERAAISLRKKGVPLAPEAAEKAAAQCRLMADMNLGRVHSTASKEKMSAAQRGNTNAVGVKHTPERNAVISAKLTGRKRAPFSQEWISAMSAARQGVPKSPEWRAKMSGIMSAKKRRGDGTFLPEGSV